jgi:hypothetical protein
MPHERLLLQFSKKISDLYHYQTFTFRRVYQILMSTAKLTIIKSFRAISKAKFRSYFPLKLNEVIIK